MPTEQGGETIGERLDRLRADLARVRHTVARQENNGAEKAMGLGTRISEVAYQDALQREKDLAADIRRLEARLAGVSSSERVALLQSRSPS